MFTECFAFLSSLTGLEVVPLQNLVCGAVGSALSPVVIYTGKRVYHACQRTPRPVSVACSRILDQLSQTGWDLENDMYGHTKGVENGTIMIFPGQSVTVNSKAVTKDLPRRELRMVYDSARAVRKVLLAEREADRKAQILAALAPGEDAPDEDDTELEAFNDESVYARPGVRDYARPDRAPLMKR